MMGWVFAGMVVIAVLYGSFGGTMAEVSAAAIGDCGKAVQLSIELLGIACLWSGIMKVADRAGLTEKLSALLYGITGRLFRGLSRDSAAMKAITLNITANLLGLGNAATPLGLTAMRELDKLNGGSKTAGAHMITFVVLNTASMQLLPNTTVAAIRLAAGSPAPLDIMPAVWISSAVSVTMAVLVAKCLEHPV